MKPNKELLLQLKHGENRYEQFFVGKAYDHSESVFSLVSETIDLLIKKIDGGASELELHELLRKRFIQTGWNTFLQDMEYVRPNDPENKVHDSVNKFYYNQMGIAIGLDDFESYLKNPKSTKKTINDAQIRGISRLAKLAEFHDVVTVSKIESAFHACFKKLNEQGKPDKENLLECFEVLLDEISELGVADTEDRELIAEIIQDCLISYGLEDSGGLLEEYL